MYEYAKSV
jgi:hypothetical protein